jgi:hypothetical protein
MHDPARRRVLTGLAAGVAGILAGCGAPTRSEETTAPEPTPTPTATPTPTPTPEPTPEVAEYRSWLPTPAALDLEPYSLGALDMAALRAAELNQRNLTPGRYTPGVLSGAFGSTTSLVTVSTGDAAGGVLQGEYDPATVGSALTDGDFAPAEGTDSYASETQHVEVSEALLLWGDGAEPESTVAAFRRRSEGDGETYPEGSPHLSAVLDRLSMASARFARPVSGESDGPFADAQFLGTGIWAGESAVRWRTALAFDGTPPEAARSHYQTQFEDKQGFEAVRTAVDGEILRLDAETSPAYATSTQPI